MMKTRKKVYKKNYADSPFEMFQVFIPKQSAIILRDKAAAAGTPLSRLIAIALDNELDSVNPFNYPVDLPDSPYIEHAYIEEAQKIVRFLVYFPQGTGIDTLILCRREIGILNRETLMLAIRELIVTGLVKEVAPSRSYFKYPAGYKYLRLASNIKETEE